MKKYKRSKIICLNDGKIYENLTELSKHLNCTKGAISSHLSGRFPHIRGLTFARMEDKITGDV